MTHSLANIHGFYYILACNGVCVAHNIDQNKKPTSAVEILPFDVDHLA
jgi:hypothetical protein